MKDIQEIMTEIDNITNKQVAVDLSDDEKKELAGLIEGNSDVALTQSATDPCCDPTIPPTICPPCTPGTFCCLIEAPTDFTIISGQLHAGVSPSPNFTVIPSTAQCQATLLNGCTVLLNSAKVTGTAKVFASIGFKDKSGNCAFLCCSDCICFCNSDVVCCGTIDPTSIKFLVSELSSRNLGSIGTNCPKNVYEITGKVTPTC